MPIPLPALDIRPPQQPDPMQSYARMLQLKSLMQGQQLQQQEVQRAQTENQMAQLQLQDRTAMTKAMQAWDGKDMSALPDLMLKNGASGSAVLQMRQGLTDYQEKLATLSKEQLANEKTKGDFIAQAIDNVKSLTPDQQPQAFESAKADLVRRGYLDPQQAQSIQYGGPAQLDTMEKIFLGHNAVVDQAAKQAAANAARFKSAGGTLYDISNPNQPRPALGSQTTPAQWSNLVDQVVAPSGSTRALNARTKSQVAFLVSQGNLEGAQKAITDAGQQIGAVEKEINPQVMAGKIAVANAEGQARMRAYATTREYPVYDTQKKITTYVSAAELNRANAEDPSRYTAAGYAPESIVPREMAEATRQITKPLTAFNTAIAHLDSLDKYADDLGNFAHSQTANRAAQALAQEFGSPNPINFDAAKGVMAGEVAAAMKASGATDPEIAKAEASFSRAQSPAQLHGAINAYRTLLKSKEQMLSVQYESGKKGQAPFQPPASDWGKYPKIQ